MKAPARRCTHPGCKYHVPCPQHTRDERPSPAERGYDTAWRKNARAFLAANPRCVYKVWSPITGHHTCGMPAQHADHVLPRRAGGSDDWSNLQALCHSHHSTKTATFDGGFGNAPRSLP